MKFFSHKIVNPVGSTGTWNEWLENHLKTAEEKNASEAKPECDDDPRGQCRGQVINNDNEEGAHSYQEGESVDGKPDQNEGGNHKPNNTAPKSSETDTPVKEATLEAHCGKEMGECDAAGKVTEDHADAGNADEGNAEVQQNINNDPNYQKGESTNPGKVDGKNKKTEASKKGFQKIASLDRRGKLELFAYMAARQKNGTQMYPMPYIEAMVGLTFANMKDDEKEWLRTYWKTQYPESYVEEMVEDR